MFTEESMNKFKENLQKVSDFTHSALQEAMGKVQVVIVNNAKSEHPYIKLGTPNPPGHPSKRYYTHTGQLTNSVRPGNVYAKKEEITGEVKAGDSSLTAYAAYVERRYPFMQVAIDEEQDTILNIFANAVKEVVK